MTSDQKWMDEIVNTHSKKNTPGPIYTPTKHFLSNFR